MLPGLYREARGILVLPSGETIHLGTREVEAFDIPDYEFDKVLFVEKMGLEGQLAEFHLGQRFDMAIVFSKGYSVTACRNLLTRIAARAIDIFVLHDADLDGYGIKRTLCEATKRMPDHSIEVEDLGLTVPQAISLGLETEAVIRKKAIPKDQELDDLARDWFTGTPFKGPKGEDWFHATRCELNAFSAPELAAFIEGQLLAHDVVPKLVPPSDVLDPHVEEIRDDHIDTLIGYFLRDRIDFAEIVTQVKERHPEVVGVIDEERVRDWFDSSARNTKEPWTEAVSTLIDEDIDAVAEVEDTIKALVIEQLTDNN